MSSSPDQTAPSDAPTRRRMPVPDGTIPVGLALLVAGTATFAFFRIGTVAVGGEDAFTPIVSLWFATFALAPGFFLPLEQELGRALAHRRAIGDGSAPVVRKVAKLSAVLVAVILLVILAASPLIARSYFDGDWLMVVALMATFAAFAPAHLARGICSGSGRFREYALIMGSDGVIRIILTIVLAIIGIKAAGAYGMVIAISPLFAVGYVWRRGALAPFPRRRLAAGVDVPAGDVPIEAGDDDVLDEGSPAEWNEVTPNLGWLLLGSVFAAALLNAGPITATLLASDNEADFVTQFSFGVLLARIPLFLFQAVQAALLPGLSRLAARGELVEFRAGLLRLAYLVIVVGIVGTAGAFILGPLAADLVYDVDLSGRTLAMLALASSVYMLALALGQAVIALKGHALVALGWGFGLATFVLVTWLSSDELFRRIEFGLLFSSVAAFVAFAIALQRRLASGVVPDQGSVIEATAPLE
ncbi:lipopolysaccharide biosynthesis protein [Ilumatobacter sp.]|uniref:lipopolysaccharide biosynthesis protein n=1 Tax=Ilumatobacter sp. TaxID=1967498 RepID=UPI003C5A6FB4